MTSRRQIKSLSVTSDPITVGLSEKTNTLGTPYKVDLDQAPNHFIYFYITDKLHFIFNFFLISPLSFSNHKPFSTQLGTVTASFYLLVIVKFPFAPFNMMHAVCIMVSPL